MVSCHSSLHRLGHRVQQGTQWGFIPSHSSDRGGTMAMSWQSLGYVLEQNNEKYGKRPCPQGVDSQVGLDSYRRWGWLYPIWLIYFVLCFFSCMSAISEADAFEHILWGITVK